MKNLISKRLLLQPLNAAQLRLLSKNRHLLEKSLGLNLSDFQLSADASFMEEFQSAIANYTIPQVEDNPHKFQWFTHWLIIDNAENITIGGIGGTGLPDDNGEVMVGYFIDKKYEGCGYATEALGVFIHWLISNTAVKAIVADTPLDHIASQKVLHKNHFIAVGEVDGALRWRLDV